METEWGSDQILQGDSTVNLVVVDFEIAHIVHSGSWLKGCGFPEALEDCGVCFSMVFLYGGEERGELSQTCSCFFPALPSDPTSSK